MSQSSDLGRPRDGADPRCVVARGVSRRYRVPDGDVDALVDVDVDADHGALTVVAGPSGSGKSTLLMIVAALERSDAGEVDVNAVRIDRLSARARREWRRRQLGMVLPRPADNLTLVHDAAGNLVWASAQRRGVSALTREQAVHRLAELGLERVVDETVPQLSGGEQMRLAFACAAAGAPRVVVADEPTASLDREAGAMVLATIRTLTAGGTAVLVATHDPAVVDAADAVVRLDHGRRVG